MLSNIIKSNAKALTEIFSNKEFYESVDSDKEKHKNYLVDLVLQGFLRSSSVVTLPKEVIPNTITLYAFAFTHEKDPLILPILLKYFARKNLLKEIKDDLDKINQKLQSVMDKDIKDLQDKKTKLQEDKTNLDNVKIHSGEAKVLAIDEMDKQITTTSSEIEKIELYKKHIETLLSGGEVKVNSYPLQYLSILKDGLTKVMEEKLKTYVENNKADVEKTYHSLTSKAKKILLLGKVGLSAQCVSLGFFMFAPLVQFFVGIIVPKYHYEVSPVACSLYAAATMVSVAATSLVIAGVAYLVNRHYKKSFAKEMKNFIEGPVYISKAINAESGEKSEQKETKVGDLIDFSCNDDECNNQVTPPAPPLEEEMKESYLYPGLEVPYSLSGSSFFPSIQRSK